MTCINGPELGNHAITSEYVMPLSMTTLQFRLLKAIDKTCSKETSGKTDCRKS